MIRWAKINWKGKELTEEVRRESYRGLLRVVVFLQNQIRKNLSQSTRKNGPSAPGEFPHADTGKLRQSIQVDVDKSTLKGVVGTTLKYGVALEYGTAGHTIEPKTAKALSWLSRTPPDNPDEAERMREVVDGEVFFRFIRRRVTKPPQAARSFIRRTFNENKSYIAATLGKGWRTTFAKASDKDKAA